MPSPDDESQLLAVCYIVEGILFSAYSVWRLVISPIQFYRAPPALSGAYVIFIFLMFAAGILFIMRFLIFLKGALKPSRLDLFASILVIPLWSLPALIAVGSTIGFLFITIGIFNLLLLFLTIYLIRSRHH